MTTETNFDELASQYADTVVATVRPRLRRYRCQTLFTGVLSPFRGERMVVVLPEGLLAVPTPALPFLNLDVARSGRSSKMWKLCPSLDEVRTRLPLGLMEIRVIGWFLFSDGLKCATTASADEEEEGGEEILGPSAWNAVECSLWVLPPMVLPGDGCPRVNGGEGEGGVEADSLLG